MVSKQVNLDKQISDVISGACRQINMNTNEVMSVGIGIDCVIIRPRHRHTNSDFVSFILKIL